MTLKQWLDNSWLRAHKTSREEIANLFGIVARDLLDAKSSELSPDWKFGIAYNAALKLCTIVLYAEGYKAEKNQAHYRTLQASVEVFGKEMQADAEYLDVCRVKRNTVEYDYVAAVSIDDANELIEFVSEFEKKVRDWIKKKHPGLV